MLDGRVGQVRREALSGKAGHVLGSGLGAAPGEFDAPAGLTVDDDLGAWVVDTGNRRLQHFAWGGQLLGIVGEPGQFDQPQAIAVAPERGL